MALADDLAAYAADVSFADLPDGAVEAARHRVLDAVACSYAARDADPVQQVERVAARKHGDREARILGTDTVCAVEYAALATGTRIRYLDWNDTYLSREPAHPSDNLGAVIPVAAAHGRSGKELLAAMAVGYEAQCRLCDAASLRARGFDHVNYGLVSATLAAGRLMGLDRDALADAVGIAVNGHVALRQARAGELTAWKGIAFANAARNAVVACQLAQEGLDGPAPIFEGRFGVFEQLTGAFELDIDAWGGGDWAVANSSIKYYPVEYHAQAAVHLALQLREQHGIDPADIERVENETYEAAVSIIGEEDEKWRPKTRETADHSMPYCIARALLDGAMTLDQFAPGKVQDEQAYALMDRITVDEREAFTDRYGDAFPHRMRIMTDEEEYEAELDHPKGHPDNPLTADERMDKLRRAAPTSVDADAVAAAVDDLAAMDDAAALLDAVEAA